MNPSAEHDRHDLLLVVAYATNDATGADRDRAAALVDSCPDCTALAGDVQRIAAASADLPSPRRTRDFRLTAADAARLRPVGWRGILAAFAGPRLAFTRPLAAGLTTLGLAGLLATAVPTAFLGGAATSGAATTGAGAAPGASPAASAAAAPFAPAAGTSPDQLRSEFMAQGSAVPSAAAAPSPPTERDAAGYNDLGAVTTPTATVAPTSGLDVGKTLPADADEGLALERGRLAAEPQPASPVLVLSVMFLVVGLGFFALRWTARRLA